jgi:hypothetical protein
MGHSTRETLRAPSSEQLIGPANGTWGRDAGEYRRVAHFPTDGVIKSPPADGIDATIDGRSNWLAEAAVRDQI